MEEVFHAHGQSQLPHSQLQGYDDVEEGLGEDGSRGTVIGTIGNGHPRVGRPAV